MSRQCTDAFQSAYGANIAAVTGNVSFPRLVSASTIANGQKRSSVEEIECEEKERQRKRDVCTCQRSARDRRKNNNAQAIATAPAS